MLFSVPTPNFDLQFHFDPILYRKMHMINKETTIHQSLYDADVNIYLPTEAFNKEQNSYRVYEET